MPKAPKPPTPKKLPSKLLDDPASRAAGITRTSAKQDAVGDVADRITRAPKKKR